VELDPGKTDLVGPVLDVEHVGIGAVCHCFAEVPYPR
jgi:hypothetical protein